ncbi:MAG: DUF5719 family protein [Nitriliruptor sp.]
MASPIAALALLVTTLALVGVVGVVTDPVEEEVATPEVPPELQVGADAVSGRAVCAVGDARAGTATEIDVVRPGVAGDAPATAEVSSFGEGDAEPLATTRLFPGAASRTSVEGDEAEASEVRWAGGPVATLRHWRLGGEEDLPAGTAAGPCVATTAATTWTIPGLTTEGGGEARLRIANPHGTGATVAVGFLTPEGPEDPTRLRNVSVGPWETVELELNEYLPEQPDLAVVVEVASGRVAVEGVQLTRSAIGGVDGVSLLQAATEPSQVWTVPWIIAGEGRSSWLWIANRTDRSAPVELSYHTADGGAVPELLSEVSVPPNTVRRIDLADTLPEGQNGLALTARSDGVPVTVSGTARIVADDPADTGFAVQLGAPASDRVWTVSGNGRPGRTEQLRLINPGSEPVRVDGTLWTGSQASQPPELAGLEVAPGAQLTVPLGDLLQGAPSWSLTVRATSGDLVTALVSSGDPDGPRHLVATTGAPSAWWTLPRPPTRRSAPGTAQRLGTELGIEPIDPLAPPDEGGAPEPPSEDGAVDADATPPDPAEE